MAHVTASRWRDDRGLPQVVDPAPRHNLRRGADVGAASAAYDRGAAHAAAGRYDVAIGELLAALALAPAAGDAAADDVAASADFVLGWIYQRREEWHGAEVSYRRSLARGPGPEALANLAVVLHERGGAGDAAALLAEGAAALAPASDAFRRNAAALRDPRRDAGARDVRVRPCPATRGAGRCRSPDRLAPKTAARRSTRTSRRIRVAAAHLQGGSGPRTRRGDRWDDAYRAYFPPIDEGWDVVVDGGGTYGRRRAAFFDAAASGRLRPRARAARPAASPAADGHYARHVRSWADALGPDRTLWLPTSADDAAGLVFAFLGPGRGRGACSERDNARVPRPGEREILRGAPGRPGAATTRPSGAYRPLGGLAPGSRSDASGARRRRRLAPDAAVLRPRRVLCVVRGVIRTARKRRMLP
ncbi:hypothetical protein JL720_6870 [Aureococcus anophagefferens]|nr:hypothetical protein JL720_6870 [Aureococcus anophagefferens]